MNHGPHRPHGRDDARPLTKGDTLAGELKHEDLAYRIRGAVFEVNRYMGAGFLEPVYQECLAIEFERRGILFVQEPQLEPVCKGRLLTHHYKPDFVCCERIVVELKAVRELAPEHRAQVMNYMRAGNLDLGLLVNFGCAPARIERFVL